MAVEDGRFKPGMEEVAHQDRETQGKGSLRERMRDFVGGIIFEVSTRFNPLGTSDGEESGVSVPFGETATIEYDPQTGKRVETRRETRLGVGTRTKESKRELPE